MALIKCSECGKEISDTTKKCIHCGAKIKKERKKLSKKKKLIILSIVILTVIVGVVTTYVIFSKEEVEVRVDQSNERDDTKEQIEVITDYINIREKKSIDSKAIGKVYEGEIYTVISQDDRSPYYFIEIETKDGKHGFISGQDGYVEKLSMKEVVEEETEPLEEQVEQDITDNNVNNAVINEPVIEYTPPVVQEQPQDIVIQNIWMDNAGGTFRVGDTITIHASVSSKNKLTSAVIWLHSTVNNQSIECYVAHSPDGLNTNDIVIQGTITDRMLPGPWEYHWSGFTDQYNINVTEYNNPGRFSFTVVE